MEELVQRLLVCSLALLTVGCDKLSVDNRNDSSVAIRLVDESLELLSTDTLNLEVEVINCESIESVDILANGSVVTGLFAPSGAEVRDCESPSPSVRCFEMPANLLLTTGEAWPGRISAVVRCRDTPDVLGLRSDEQLWVYAVPFDDFRSIETWPTQLLAADSDSVVAVEPGSLARLGMGAEREMPVLRLGAATDSARSWSVGEHLFYAARSGLGETCELATSTLYTFDPSTSSQVGRLDLGGCVVMDVQSSGPRWHAVLGECESEQLAIGSEELGTTSFLAIPGQLLGTLGGTNAVRWASVVEGSYAISTIEDMTLTTWLTGLPAALPVPAAISTDGTFGVILDGDEVVILDTEAQTIVGTATVPNPLGARPAVRFFEGTSNFVVTGDAQSFSGDASARASALRLLEGTNIQPLDGARYVRRGETAIWAECLDGTCSDRLLSLSFGWGDIRFLWGRFSGELHMFEGDVFACVVVGGRNYLVRQDGRVPGSRATGE